MLFIKAAAVLAAAGAVGVAGHSELAAHNQSASSRTYIVRSGDTLSRIAGRFCGNPGAYPALARASGISNPNVIYAGQKIILTCGSSSNNSSSGTSTRTTSISGSSYQNGSAVIPATFHIYSFAGLERLWIAAGGSPSRAYYAACIAEHESSGRPWVISPTNDWGLWQIHAGGYGMLAALPNAQRAVAMSSNGTNWSQWPTRRYC
jgi:LysM repeat protein